MPKLPGISHAEAIRVFSKIGFRITREGKHTIMRNDGIRLVIPRHRLINAFTMADIATEAGLSPREFRDLL